VITLTPVTDGYSYVNFACTSNDIAQFYLPEGCTNESTGKPNARLRLICSDHSTCALRVVGVRGIVDGDWDTNALARIGGTRSNANTAHVVFSTPGMHQISWTGRSVNGSAFTLTRLIRVAQNRAPQLYERTSKRVEAKARYFPRGKAGDYFEKDELMYYKLITKSADITVSVQLKHTDGKWYTISNPKRIKVTDNKALARMKIPQAARYRILVNGGNKAARVTSYFLESQ